MDVLTADNIALGQRAEAHGAAVACNLLNLGSERDVVPCYVLADVVGGNALLVELYLHGACGVGHAGHGVLQSVLFESSDGFFSEFVFAECTNGHGVGLSEELACMISEVGRCSAEFLTFRQHIPKCFAEADDISLFHIVL